MKSISIEIRIFIKTLTGVLFLVSATTAAYAQQKPIPLEDRVRQLETRLEFLEQMAWIEKVGAEEFTITAGATSTSIHIDYENPYPHPPVVLLGECGIAGAFVVGKAERFNETGFDIALTFFDNLPRKENYSSRIGYALLRDNLDQEWEDDPATLFRNLKVGKRYRISRPTPLADSWNPQGLNETAKAIAEIKELNAESVITVLEIKKDDPWLWYKVEAVDSKGQKQTGFINSLALIGQELVEVDQK